MEKSYKFRLYPNAKQTALLEKTFGCVRFVYNYFLAQRIALYKETGKGTTRFAQDKELTQLKQKLEWPRDPLGGAWDPCGALQPRLNFVAL